MSRPIRYFTDEHVPQAVASALRKRGIDVQTVADAELFGATDEDLLLFAQDKERVIVTQDQDFLRIAATASNHTGIVYAPQGRSIGEMVRMLDLLVQVNDADEMRGRVEGGENRLVDYPLYHLMGVCCFRFRLFQ